MRSFPKRRIFISLSVAVAAGLIACALAQKKVEEKPRTKEKKEVVQAEPDKDSKDPKATKDAKDAKDTKDAKPKEKRKIDIQVSKGHPAKKVKLPYLDGNGKKQMFFTIGEGSYVDEEHVGLAETQIETFDDDGKPEMTIDLPSSRLNVFTTVIKTDKHMEIRREDFTLTGEGMEFNMTTKQGTLTGGVRMIIHNLDNEISPAPAPQPKSP